MAIVVEKPIPLKEQVKLEIAKLAPKIGVSERITLALADCESKFNPYATGTQAVVGVDLGPLQVNSYYHAQEMRDEGLNIKNWHDSLYFGMTMLKRDGTVHWEASRACWIQKI